MTSRDFCYWLQGFFEVAKPSELTPEQTDLVKRHLNMVFIHEIDPSLGPPEHQAKLDAAHSGVQGTVNPDAKPVTVSGDGPKPQTYTPRVPHPSMKDPFIKC